MMKICGKYAKLWSHRKWFETHATTTIQKICKSYVRNMWKICVVWSQWVWFICFLLAAVSAALGFLIAILQLWGPLLFRCFRGNDCHCGPSWVWGAVPKSIKSRTVQKQLKKWVAETMPEKTISFLMIWDARLWGFGGSDLRRTCNCRQKSMFWRFRKSKKNI